MSPPKTINKSKISTVFNKNFTSTKLKKIPKKYASYLPTDLPNNGSPRTAYDRRGLLKYFTSQSPMRRDDPPPRSPMTRKPVNPMKWWSDLYTNEELQASKHKKSDKYKLIEHMKTRKHLSAKQKMEYLNELKNGKKINNLINKINNFTIPKQNIPVKTRINRNVIEEALGTMDNAKTNASLFKPRLSESEHINTLNGDREWAKFFKKVRTLVLEKIVKELKSNNNPNNVKNKFKQMIPVLELTLLAAEYMENPEYSDFAKEIPKFKISKNKLYDYIKKNIFTKDGMEKIQIYIVHTFYKLIFGKYLTEHEIYLNSKDVLRRIKNQGGKFSFYGEILESTIQEDFENAVYDLMDNVVEFLNKQNLKHKNIKYRNKKFIKKYLNAEPMFNKKEKIIKEIPSTFFPKNIQSSMRKLFLYYI
jgi:hypothetical protein